MERKSHFFWRSEPGTGARLQKMWRENRTFFGGLNLEQVLGYRKCGEKIALFLAVWTWNRCWVTENVERKSHFFWRSEPGTGARLQKMWRENRTFFGGLNLEQVLGYRKCGEKIALFFCGLNLEQVLAHRKCGEKIALFLAV